MRKLFVVGSAFAGLMLGGCSSINGTQVNGNKTVCGCETAGLHGTPTTLDGPQHYRVEIVETNWVTPAGNPLVDTAAKPPSTRTARVSVGYFKEILAVDFAKAGADSLGTTATLDPQRQGLTSTDSKMVDTTSETTKSINDLASALGPTSRSVRTVSGDGNLKSHEKIVAVTLVDVADPRAREKMHAFLGEHLNGCQVCSSRAGAASAAEIAQKSGSTGTPAASPPAATRPAPETPALLAVPTSNPPPSSRSLPALEKAPAAAAPTPSPSARSAPAPETAPLPSEPSSKSLPSPRTPTAPETAPAPVRPAPDSETTPLPPVPTTNAPASSSIRPAPESETTLRTPSSSARPAPAPETAPAPTAPMASPSPSARPAPDADALPLPEAPSSLRPVPRLEAAPESSTPVPPAPTRIPMPLPLAPSSVAPKPLPSAPMSSAPMTSAPTPVASEEDLSSELPAAKQPGTLPAPSAVDGEEMSEPLFHAVPRRASKVVTPGK